MLAISEAIIREFAPRFTKNDAAAPMPMTFSARELLAISQEISREFSPRPVENRSSLALLPVDPGHLHAYWHLAEPSLKAELESVADKRYPAPDEQLTLRVFVQPAPAAAATDRTEQSCWFDIPLDRAQNRQQVTLPADTAVAGTRCRAAIGISHRGHGFTAFAYSNAAAIPNPRPRGDHSGLPESIAQFIIPTMNGSSSTSGADALQDIKGLR